MFAGFTLLEVLISLFLLSLLLLGLDAMQLTALHQAKSAYYFSVASEQLHSMRERLQVIKGENVEVWQQAWNEQNRVLLPHGVGKIQGTAPEFVLSIFWGNKTSDVCDRNKIGQSGCLTSAIKIVGPL